MKLNRIGLGDGDRGSMRCVWYGGQAAEESEKQIPRGLKSARDDKIAGLFGTAEGRALIQSGYGEFFTSVQNPALPPGWD
jgi:hypothetical protein